MSPITLFKKGEPVWVRIWHQDPEWEPAEYLCPSLVDKMSPHKVILKDGAAFVSEVNILSDAAYTLRSLVK